MLSRLNDICATYLSQKAYEDEYIWVLDGDLADSDGADKFLSEHKNRFINTGIAEQTMISMAAGMCACGLKPWVFSFAAFLCYRAYDQIRVCISQTGLPVTLVGSHSGGCVGKNGKTHTAINDICCMASLPGFEIWSPADSKDVLLAIETIGKRHAPSYIRLPRDPVADMNGISEEIRWIDTPNPIAIVSHGLATQWALATRSVLKEQFGIPIGILHLSKVWPHSKDTLLSYLSMCSHIFILEDHIKFGGLAASLKNLNLKAEIHNYGWPNSWPGQSGSSSELRQLHGLLPEQLARDIILVLKN